MEEHNICLSEKLTYRGYVFVRVMGGSKKFRRAGGVLTSSLLASTYEGHPIKNETFFIVLKPVCAFS